MRERAAGGTNVCGPCDLLATGDLKSLHTNIHARRDRPRPGVRSFCHGVGRVLGEYERVRGPKGVQLHARVRTGHG